MDINYINDYCDKNKLSYRELKEFRFISSNGSYKNNFYLVQNNILVIRVVGDLDAKSYSESIPMLEDLFDSLGKGGKISLLHDYSEFGKITMFSRKHYVSLILKHIDILDKIVFNEVSLSVTYMIRAGRLLSSKLRNVKVFYSFEESMEYCLSESKAVNGVLADDSLPTRRIGGNLYTVKENDNWSGSYGENSYQKSFVLDDDIVVRELTGSLHKGDMEELVDGYFLFNTIFFFDLSIST